jgi:polyisoprenyl-phosphate glycosyltransferase
MEYSIVLPVFNEEKNVRLIVDRYAKIAKRYDIEVIFVEDGGSKDNTRGELRKAAKKHRFVKPLFTSERGYGASIFNGLKAAKGEYVSWTHADMQTDPADTAKAYELIRKQKDPKKSYVKGQRYGRPLFDQFFTSGMSAFETAYLGTILYDINAQPNMFHRSFIKGLKNAPADFSFDLYMLYVAKRRGLNLVRFPVRFGKRIFGQSAWNTGLLARYKFIKRTLAFSFRLDKELAKVGVKQPGIFRKYWGLLKEILRVPLFGFLFFGGLSTIVNYGVFYLLYALAGLNYLLSSGAGYASGVLFSFGFNRAVSFQSKGKAHHELAKYFAVYTASLLISLGLLWLLVDKAGMNALLANILVIIVTTCTNFLGCKWFVFR